MSAEDSAMQERQLARLERVVDSVYAVAVASFVLKRFARYAS